MPAVVKYTGPFKEFSFFTVPARLAVAEIRDIVVDKAQESFEEQRVNDKAHSALISSFEQKPVTQGGVRIFKATVTVGGPSAPYAPIVDHVGWKTTTGRKSPYFFMKAGAEAGQEVSGDIVIKHFSKYL